MSRAEKLCTNDGDMSLIETCRIITHARKKYAGIIEAYVVLASYRIVDAEKAESDCAK